MKKLFFLIVISLSFPTVLYAETTIRITNGEWQPYLSEYSYQFGLASHIVTEAFRSEEIDIEWGFFPWKRSYDVAKKGKNWDASAAWWPSKEAKEDFLLSDSVVSTSFVFFHLKSYKFKWESVDDLKGLQIGFTRGYDYGKEFMEAMKEKKITVQTANSDELNYKKLLAGRTNIFPNDPVVGGAQIRDTFSPEKVKLFTNHPKEFEVSTLHLLISKNCKNGKLLLEKFNSGLKKLKESGRLDQMCKDLDSGKYDKQKSKWKQ